MAVVPGEQSGTDLGIRLNSLPRTDAVHLLVIPGLVPGIKTRTHFWAPGRGAAIDPRHKGGDDDEGGVSVPRPFTGMPCGSDRACLPTVKGVRTVPRGRPVPTLRAPAPIRHRATFGA